MSEATNNKENWAEAINRAKQHFNEGWRDLGKAAELAKEKGVDSLEEARIRGREAWVSAKAHGAEFCQDAKQSGQETWDEVRDRGEAAIKDAEQLVRKHPTKAVGLSILVGVFLGALLGRDRD